VSADFEPLESLPPARKRIVATLLTHGWERFDIEDALGDFAHELAEEIRGERDRMRDEATQDALNAMSYAANLIDPQGREGTRP